MHTPGLWIAIESHDKREDGYIREATATEDGRHVAVAQVTRAARPFSEYRANARLIAAAPEMLAALKAALPAIDKYATGSADVIDAIRAAIAKAATA
ncbi:hypothetical protein [Mesorhizobium sp.]|uniref:hypothetical protein n=1 Tax=Mesorhizobium sp. TaxID=1871066 RepID=UPI00120D12F5|nr:hypothetical protein [Mesorhizobium sp.]TIN82219.1 MAG: hypothetical protein E5X97_31190 [Mesorhizobium sp.]